MLNISDQIIKFSHCTEAIFVLLHWRISMGSVAALVSLLPADSYIHIDNYLPKL